MGDRLLQHRMEVPMEGIFNNTDVNRLPHPVMVDKRKLLVAYLRIEYITRQGSVYIDTDDNI